MLAKTIALAPNPALKRGYIDKEDLKIFKVVNEPEEAVKIIENFYKK